jgi:EAL domain-containing protein (putative c-di-GMP-specific phosphodiesterase class I)
LIRWRHPQRGYISPALFIPAAEASGLILPIGNWVLHEACRQAASWRNAGFPSIQIAVNVSSKQFAEGKLTQQVTDALSQYKLPSTCLKLEITESMLMQDVDHAITMMQELVDMGVRLAIDDFGTGYSSLSYLGRFCISELKIDQSFVRNLPSDADNAAIVHTIISLARNLKLGVIAEGVETEAQMDFLKNAGCHEMQGYYFSKPLNPEAMTKILQERKDILGTVDKE